MIFHRIVDRMLLALALTVVIEGCGAFLLGVRTRRGQVVVLLANLITNPVLQCTMTAVSFFWSPSLYYYFLIPLEIAVVALEGRIYKSTLRLKLNPFLFSFALNAGSYFIGRLIVKILF